MSRTARCRKTLPVCLLLEGKRCLVVGGGAVAGRKAEALLDAGAKVTLVAPTIGERAAGLRKRRGFTLACREFAAEDLKPGLFLAVTATDDAALNRRILDACHARGLLCACPDRGWQDGDLISPASFRHGDLTVSVSTGGASCRRSRLIKESLARHAEALGNADLLVLGTDHRHVKLADREQLHLGGERTKRTAEELRQLLGIHEFMLLATCNRIEIAGLAAVSPALLRLASRSLGLDRLGGRFYVHRGFDAFRHMAFVAAGLLSQTPRETHIRAQIKDALEESRREGWSAGILHDWVGRALRVGNAIRRETGGILKATEIEERCAAFVSQALEGLRGRRVLVVGAGAVGAAAVRELAAGGAAVSCCYRSRPPSLSVPGAQVTLLPLKRLGAALRGVDAVVCAASGGEAVLTGGESGWIAPGRPLLVVDLGAPRNVAPDFAAGRREVRIANLDDLNRWDDRNGGRLCDALAAGDRIVREHNEDYERIVSGIKTGD
jgi:glutamyl-tRNA reductase